MSFQSPKMAPFDRSYTTSHQSAIVSTLRTDTLPIMVEIDDVEEHRDLEI